MGRDPAVTSSQQILRSDSLCVEGGEEQNKDFRLPLFLHRFQPPKLSKLTLYTSTKSKIKLAR